MGEFIEITLEADALGADEAARVAAVCPVDIFAVDDGRLVVRPEEVDECTLCELCLDAAPAGAIAIRKLYKSQVLHSRGVKIGA